MMEDVKNWLRGHAGKVLVCAMAGLLALSLFPLVTSLSGDGTSAAEAEADRLLAQLEKDLDTARTDLETEHGQLLRQLSGVDIDRVARDEATGRSILLSLVDTSGSSRNVLQTQVRLDARYDFLDQQSQVLTGFIPEWLAATGSGTGTGTTYKLVDPAIDVSSVRGLDYSYTGVARLDPVTAGGSTSAKSEYVVFTYSTGQDGAVTSFEAYRASDAARNALVAERTGSQERSGGTADEPVSVPNQTESG